LSDEESKNLAGAMRFAIQFFSREEKNVKQTLRIQASLAFAILTAVWLSSCGKGSSADEAVAAPTNEVDIMINEYDKVTNQYVRMARKFKGGDVSVTVPYIELGKETRKSSAKLQEIAPKMTPQQTQRVASISAKATPYLQK
jgi:hypothetical protein